MARGSTIDLRVVSGSLVLAGVIALAVGLSGEGIEREAAELAEIGIRVTGRTEGVDCGAVAEHVGQERRGPTSCRATVVFRTPDGLRREVTLDVSQGIGAGQPVEILYDPGDPARAVLARHAEPDAFSPVSVGLGALLVLAGIGLFVVHVRRRRS